jgi:hypothetical protein
VRADRGGTERSDGCLREADRGKGRALTETRDGKDYYTLAWGGDGKG